MIVHEALQLPELPATYSERDLWEALQESVVIWHADRFMGNADLFLKAETRTHTILVKIWRSSHWLRTSAPSAGTWQV